MPERVAHVVNNNRPGAVWFWSQGTSELLRENGITRGWSGHADALDRGHVHAFAEDIDIDELHYFAVPEFPHDLCA